MQSAYFSYPRDFGGTARQTAVDWQPRGFSCLSEEMPRGADPTWTEFTQSRRRPRKFAGDSKSRRDSISERRIVFCAFCATHLASAPRSLLFHTHRFLSYISALFAILSIARVTSALRRPSGSCGPYPGFFCSPLFLPYPRSLALRFVLRSGTLRENKKEYGNILSEKMKGFHGGYVKRELSQKKDESIN